jgi:tetratricopeptide (TPR) repeat protein
MIFRTLVALSLGCLLLIILPGPAQILHAQQPETQSTGLIERYRASLMGDQGNLTLHYLLGIALLQNQQNAEALAELQTAYPAYQDSIEAHFNLAIAALRLNDLDSAEIYLDQAIALGADTMQGVFPIADLYFNMALKSRSQGDSNEAIRYFHKVLKLAPQRYEVYRQLGDLYANLEETELATKSFRNYLEQFPDDRVSQDYLFALEFNRGQDYLAEENFDEASAHFKEALKVQPDSPTARYYLGYIAYTRGDADEAAWQLEKAFEVADESLRQNLRPLLYNTTLSLKQAGQTSKALKLATQLADSSQAQLNELFLAGNLHLEYGSYRTAYDYLQRAAEQDPTHHGVQQNLISAEIGAFNEWLTTARVSMNKGEFDKAEDALLKAEQLQLQNLRVVEVRKELFQKRQEKASSYFSGAQASLDSGDLTDALSQLEFGLTLYPTSREGESLKSRISDAMSADINKLLDAAELATSSGDWAEAEELYQNILVIAPKHPQATEGISRLHEARQEHVAELYASGKEALNAGRSDTAVELFTQLVDLEPDDELARQGLMTAQQAQANRLDEYLLKGHNALGRKNFDEARQWFNKAIKIEDSERIHAELAALDQHIAREADSLANAASLAAQKTRYRDAKKLYAKALKLSPGHKASIDGQTSLEKLIDDNMAQSLGKGLQALDKGDDQRAATEFRKVLELSPENQQALDGLRKSRDNQAQKLEETVALGLSALEDGDLTKAQELLDLALARDAYHGGAQQLRQRLEKVQQSGAKPGDEQQLYLQGVAFYTQGKYPDAIKAWETVLLLDPKHEKAQLNIEKTRRKLRQIEEYRGG